MQRPYMRVTFVDQQSLTMMNPKPYTCAGFGTCSYWHRTSSVSWKNLSSDLSCYFYSDENCKRTGFFFISDCKALAGGYTFEEKKKPSIRSLMLGDRAAENRGPPLDYMSACPKRKEAGDVTANDTTATSFVWGVEDELSGGLSSNWNDDLPDKSSISST